MMNISKRIKNNEVGIIPHDTIPGIVGRMTEENALKILKLKNRSKKKGFIILIPNTAFLTELVEDVPIKLNHIITNYWPGMLTIIFKKKPTISNIISGNQTTIAIRYPKHPELNKLLNELNEPLLSTSANISGEQEISSELRKSVDFIADDHTLKSSELASTIIDGTSPALSVLRQGSLHISV